MVAKQIQCKQWTKCRPYIILQDPLKTMVDKKIRLTSQLRGSLIGSNGLIYSKSRAGCHSFQPIKYYIILYYIILHVYSALSNAILMHFTMKGYTYNTMRTKLM